MSDAPHGTDNCSRVVAALSLCLCFFFSGIIFGWAPMQLMLENDGVYRNLCPDSDPMCEKRMNRLFLVYTVGFTACVLGGLPCGFLEDYIGPLRSSILCGTCVTMGLLVFAFSNDSGLDLFVPGSLLLGFGGIFVLQIAMPTALLLPGSRRTLFLSASNCLFDSSTVISLCAFKLYTHFGISRRSLFVGMAALSAALHLALTTAWSRGPSAKLQAMQAAEVANRESHTTRKEVASVIGRSGTVASFGTVSISVAVASGSVCDFTGLEGAKKSGPPLHGLPLLRQLRTFEFAFALVTFGFQLFRSVTYLGSEMEVLRHLGDEDTGYMYTQMLAVSLPLSTFFLPLITWCLDRRGFGDTFLLIAALGVIYNGVALVPILPLQVIAFAAYTNFRAFLYCAHFNFVLRTFGSRTSGSVQGVIVSVAGPARFLIWPCKVIANVFENGHLYLYGFTLLLCVPPSVMALILKRRLRRNPAADCRAAPEMHGMVGSQSSSST